MRKINRKVDHLMKHLLLENPEESADRQKLAGLTFVITGSLEHFSNRSEMKNQIEALGGKVTGSVTRKTSYLINNDTASSSSKKQKGGGAGDSGDLGGRVSEDASGMRVFVPAKM